MKPVSKIVISACTYQRPQGLKELFASLKTIKIPDDVSLSIRIIDNEPVPAAKDLVDECAKDMPCPVHYAHEKEGGISIARNRALVEAIDDDFLVFVDDDETVHEDWLTELWECQKCNQGQFVQGPVILATEDQNDEWWIDTILFKQKT